MRDGGFVVDAIGDPHQSLRAFPGADGIVHDLGNLIQIAVSAVNIINRSSHRARDGALEPVIERALTALDRAGVLIRQVRQERTKPEFEIHAMPALQNVSSCLEEIHSLLCWICEPNIKLSVQLASDLPPLLCNRVALQSAVLNLVINACDATPAGGAVDIRARAVENGLELRVIDDGIGMSRETLAQVFTPYFTTKVDGRGTGLGLSMVKRFAYEAGGQAEIESVLGEGTAVILTLPAACRPCDG